MAEAPEHLEYSRDRVFRVPTGATVQTGYVDIFKVRLACRDRIALGDVAEAYRKVLQLGDCEQFPCPNGYWDDETFVIRDGRHHWIASLMNGKTHLLVAWLVAGE